MVQEEINDFAQIIGFNIVLKLTYTNENQIEYFKSQIINLYLLKSDKECSLLILLHKDDIYLNEFLIYHFPLIKIYKKRKITLKILKYWFLLISIS